MGLNRFTFYSRSIIDGTLFLSLSSCHFRSKASLSTKKNSTLRWLVAEAPKTFDWTLATDKTSLENVSLVMEGLTRLVTDDSGVKAEPALASRWTSKMPTRFEFRLRPNILWSDGTPLRANHFLQAWKRLLQNSKRTPSASLLYSILNARSFAEGKSRFEEVGIEVKDPLTIRFTLQEPTPNFPFLFAHPATWPTRFTDPSSSPLVTLGAFRLDSHSLSEYRYVRNPLYHSGQTGLPALRISVEPSLSTRVELFLAGEAELVDEISESYQTQLAKNPALIGEPNMAVVALVFNATRRPFQNLAARQAFSLSIQREELHHLIDPLALAAADLLAEVPVSPAADWNSAYSPSDARDLLAPFSFKPLAMHPTASGVLRPMPRPFLGWNPEEVPRSVAENLQAQWAKNLGVHVDILPVGKVAPEFLSAEVVLLRNDPLAPTQGLSFFNETAPSHWRNKTFEMTLQAALDQKDVPSWQQRLGEAQNLLVHDAVALPLYQPTTATLRQLNIKGLKQNAIELWDFRDTTMD